MFCKYHNTDPDSLVRLKADQIKNMVIEYIVQLKKAAKQHVSKVKRGEICVNSIKTYMMGIQSFLEFHEIDNGSFFTTTGKCSFQQPEWKKWCR
jgi:hypothetical protein